MSDTTRKNVQRYNTPNLQGEGSWVEVRLALIGESRDFIKEANRMARESGDVEDGSEEEAALNEAATKHAQNWYGRNVIAWNWKDEGGNLLPLPATNPDVLDLLTKPELEFLAAAINGSAEDQKKRPKR